MTSTKKIRATQGPPVVPAGYNPTTNGFAQWFYWLHNRKKMAPTQSKEAPVYGC